MCRHIAYVGPPVTLRSALIDPPHGLYRQSWAPRLQRHGTVNADGFGIGWYADGDPVPARYRRGLPIWGDPSLPDIARVTRSAAILAAVRSATPGTAVGEQAAAPFASGPWLFSHNGRLDGWPASAAALATATDGTIFAQGIRAPRGVAAAGGGAVGDPGLGFNASDRRTDDGGGGPASPGPLPEWLPVETRSPPDATALSLLSLEAMVDSAFLWTLVIERLRDGAAIDAALAATIGAVEAADQSGRFNFLLTDGTSIAATACGDTLWYRRTGKDGVTVASEPDDDGPGWTEVPERHVLTATPSAVGVRPLAAASRDVPARAASADRAPVRDAGAETFAEKGSLPG